MAHPSVWVVADDRVLAERVIARLTGTGETREGNEGQTWILRTKYYDVDLSLSAASLSEASSPPTTPPGALIITCDAQEASLQRALDFLAGER